MTARAKTLESFVRKALGGPAQAEAKWLAREVAGLFHGEALVVLYYGSCLRTGKMDDLILDFYVIVKGYGRAYGSAFLAFANKILPPNVFYHEAKKGKQTLRAKVSVLSLADFVRRAGPDTLNVSIWARFSQPARLVHCRDKKTEAVIAAAVARAHSTMLSQALPLLEETPSAKNLWVRALGLTYGAELRSEQAGKAEELYCDNQAYFDAVTPLILREIDAATLQNPGQALRRWMARRLNGKTVSVLRLVKAAFTFQGGIEYLAWKIERHSGVKVALKPWQRRHPLLAAPLLFLRLHRKGAVR